MKTIDFSRILIDAIQLCGLDRTDITYDTFSQIRDFANTRIRMAWEYDRWPDIVRFSPITVQKDGNINYVVKPSGAGEVYSVWSNNPNETTRAINIDFAIVHTDTEERLILNGKVTDEMIIEYRLEPAVLEGDPWDSSTEYFAGSQVFFDSGSATGGLVQEEGKPFSGNFYVCLVKNKNTDPSINTINWKKVNIPYIFGQYISRGCFADYLRSEGQFDSAQTAEAEAKYFLDLEIDKIVRQQGQIQKYNFFKTY
jgi:hypothetical protein